MSRNYIQKGISNLTYSRIPSAKRITCPVVNKLCRVKKKEEHYNTSGDGAVFAAFREARLKILIQRTSVFV